MDAFKDDIESVETQFNKQKPIRNAFTSEVDKTTNLLNSVMPAYNYTNQLEKTINYWTNLNTKLDRKITSMKP